jgi:hypothetical protein
MDEIISYKMCAVKVRNAKLRNYLKEPCNRRNFKRRVDHNKPCRIKVIDEWKSKNPATLSNRVRCVSVLSDAEKRKKIVSREIVQNQLNFEIRKLSL